MVSFLCSLQAYVYDGKTAETLGELKDGEKAHKGGIYAVSCKVVPFKLQQFLKRHNSCKKLVYRNQSQA